MDYNSFRSVINLGVEGGITLTGIITVLLLFFAYKRTGSPHIILGRLWSLLHGDKECNSPIIKNFLDEQSAVHQFNFMTGLRIKAPAKLAALQTWTSSNGETISSVAACGGYFDLETVNLAERKKLPTNWMMLGISLSLGILALVTIVSLVGVTYDRAILKMKDTGTWFSLDNNIAKAFSAQSGFFLENCPDVIASRNHPGFQQSDVAHICKWRLDKDRQRFISATVTEQRQLSGAAAILFSFLLFKSHKTLMQASAAHAMRKRLIERTRIADAAN